jgi:redox-sensitive bicupin YhaK (pirin superfamily)
MDSPPVRQTRAARTIASVRPAVETLEGEGFVVRRPFPVPGLEQIDPFLLLDHMGPRHLAPGEAKGAPDHPHRGFETVTYVLDGEFEHEDSAGHSGRLGPGDVQWMTAGAGVVHSEMPSTRLQTDGGQLHALQLWVNLPAADKMTPPRYQEYAAGRIPSVEREGVTARVVAGRFGDIAGAVETRIPITYLHLTMRPGSKVELPLPADQNAMAYVIAGEVAVGDRRATEASLVVFHRDGDGIELRVTDDAAHPADVLVLAATPINEPLVRYGPFVMNTRAEIIQAIEDFRAGRMGTIPGRVG